RDVLAEILPGLYGENRRDLNPRPSPTAPCSTSKKTCIAESRYGSFHTEETRMQEINKDSPSAEWISAIRRRFTVEKEID
ncbi:hypothetical protein SB861_68320, partial [Paraburkholderia sp. SIMBA_049]